MYYKLARNKFEKNKYLFIFIYIYVSNKNAIARTLDNYKTIYNIIFIYCLRLLYTIFNFEC